MTLADYLADATRRLADTLALTHREARIEIRLLAARTLGVEPVWLIAHDTDVLPPTRLSLLEISVRRRLSGEPVAYILGWREFHGRDFECGPGALIPRPETEHLVDAALEHGTPDADVLDLGTGTGCIAITLKLERPDWLVTGVDLSADALAIAHANGTRLAADVEWLASDLFASLDGRRFALVVSNPPYIPEADPHLMQGDLRFEPRTALASGRDGLTHIRRITESAPTYMKPGGWLLLEHGYDQGEAVPALLRSGGFTDVFMKRDLAGQPRVSGGRLP